MRALGGGAGGLVGGSRLGREQNTRHDRLLGVQCSIVTARIFSIFLNRKAKLAFLFFHVLRSCGLVQNLHSCVPKMPGTKEHESRNAHPSLNVYL